MFILFGVLIVYIYVMGLNIIKHNVRLSFLINEH